MKMILVPNYIEDATHAKLDAAFVHNPEAETERAELYQQLLNYFDEYGVIPDFSLQKKEA